MKVVIYTDPHWSTYSSIVRQRGKKYSLRLENLIDSINWVQNLAKNVNAQEIWCLGDFFDKNNLNAEELDALKEIRWENITQRFLVGNHEIVSTSDSYSSTQVFTSIGFQVIGSITTMQFGNTEVVWLPYMVEENRVPLEKIMSPNRSGKRLILSHNDLIMQYGMFKSTQGYNPDDIEKYCDLCLNGHLHNRGVIGNTYNLGNLTGQNFSEDAAKYRHCAYVLDTDTLEIQAYENPNAFNFFKIEIHTKEDLIKFAKDCAYGLKENFEGDLYFHNVIASITVVESLLNEVKDVLKQSEIIAHRIIVISDYGDITNVEDSITLEKVDHLQKFREFCIEKIGNFDIVLDELNEVCR